MTESICIGRFIPAVNKSCVTINDSNNISISRPNSTISKNFKLSYAYESSKDENERQNQDNLVFTSLLQSQIENSLFKGERVSIITFGVPKTGKTCLLNNILEKIVKTVFSTNKEGFKTNILLSSLNCSIQGEIITDNLDEYPTAKPKVREDMRKGNFYVENLTQISVTSPDEVNHLISISQTRTGNAHYLLTFTIIHIADDGTRVTSEIQILDLKGFDRNEQTKFADKDSDKTITTFTRVIDIVSSGKGRPPFRDSKIIRLLQPAFGGNSYNFFLVGFRSDEDNHDETLATLIYCEKFLGIKGTIKPDVRNHIIDYSELSKQIEELKEKINSKATKSSDLKLGLEATEDEVKLHSLFTELEYFDGILKTNYSEQNLEIKQKLLKK